MTDEPLGGHEEPKQPKCQGGRPAGGTNIHSKRAIQKLQALGFDPIEKMVAMYERLDTEMALITHDADGNPKDRYSAVALAALLGTQQKLVNDLMRYGYARSPESNETVTRNLDPITIVMTPKGQPMAEPIPITENDNDSDE